MRYARLAASVGFALGFVPAAFARGPLDLGDQTPQDYDQVQQAIDRIEPYLEEAQCGGWKDESVGVSDASRMTKIASVQGLPGRYHQWNGAIHSGMGTRIDENGNANKDDDFFWPEDTRGLVSSCWGGTRTEERVVWREKPGGIVVDPNFPEIEQRTISFPSPYFEDPMCRWRLQGGGDMPPIPLPDDGTLEYEQLSTEPEDRQSPPVCRGFCLYLNRYVYLDCLDVQVALTPTEPPIPYFVCARWGFRYLCSEEPTPDYGLTDLRDPAQQAQWTQQHEQTNQTELCPQQILEPRPDTTPPPSTIISNSRSCLGPGCRCYGVGCLFTNNGRFFWSYFRRYFASYTRGAVETDAGNDRTSNEAPVACYGAYDEFDPFHRQTTGPDRRCVINIDVSTYRDSQTGKGEFGQNSDLPDRDPSDPANQRKNGVFNPDEDLWYEKLSGAFSLLNEKEFEEDFDKDLTNVYLNIDRLDETRLRATEQLDEARPLARSNTIRAFDDTGTGRVVVSWWQKQQNEMAAALHPSVIRILLPAGWAFGIDPEDPFFRTEARVNLNEQDKRNERIELQISADEDILGSALGYIERSLLLNVEEEKVPVLIPMGSPTEYRALAEQWCTWYMRNYNEADCGSAPTDVRGLIIRIEEYADAIDDARALRAELARYAGEILALQQAITAPIGQWVKDNIEEYRTVLSEQRAVRSQFAGQWRQAQEIFDRFSSETNLPWCMNQRYTSPVYSLLDQWLPSRGLPGGRISADLLPQLRTPAPEDITIDFSTIAYMSGSIVLPVLEPVQIRISDLPKPPAGKEYTIDGLPPELPSIDRIRDYVRQAAQNLPDPPEDVEQPPRVDMRPMGEEGILAMGASIDEIGRVILDMNDRYDRFWKSIGPLKPDEPDGGRNGIKQMKELLECYDWDSDTCQHVEMDLIERFVRIGSRPLVMLNEDYDSTGAIRTFGGPCVPEDHVCTPMHPESTLPRTQWEIIGPREQPEFIDELRENVRQETLPEPVGGLSSSAMPTYDTDVNQLLPVHDVPEAIDLTPTRSSSSSSAS